MNSKIRTYSELQQLSSFLDRYNYLALRGEVGKQTFGFDRWINQKFYSSSEWRSLREKIIIRDNGCDLAVEGYDIHSNILIHHMNPIVESDIVHGTRRALDPEFLICTTHRTHNAIHFGDASLLTTSHKPRKPGDTKLW